MAPINKPTEQDLKELDNVVTAVESQFPPDVHLMRHSDRKPYILHGETAFVFIEGRHGIQAYVRFEPKEFANPQTRGKVFRDAVLGAAISVAKTSAAAIAQEQAEIDKAQKSSNAASKDPLQYNTQKKFPIKLEDLTPKSDLVN